MVNPTQAEVEALAHRYHVIPVACEIPSDMTSPIAVLKALKSVSAHCFLLESVEDAKAWGRYSILGYDPIAEITCRNGQMRVTGEAPDCSDTNPSVYLKKLLRDYQSPTITGMDFFTGGLVGYFAYDYIKYAEPSLILDAVDEEDFNDLDLMLFDKVVVFDNLLQKLYLIANVIPHSPASSYPAAVAELERIKGLLTGNRPDTPSSEPLSSGRLTSDLRPLFDREEFCAMVTRAKQFICDGDIFQVVLSNRLQADFEGSLLDTYRALRMTNPSPYMFYFSSDRMEMAGASPETLVKLKDGVLHTFPLAGTRKRGANPDEDMALENDLLTDEKELAEHNMLVDLGRNDLGKISRFGSVKLESYKSVLKFSHVMHLGSTVRGELREGLDAVDAVGAVLPAGTLSGAPKIRACEIINELENNKRGVYGGAVGYLDFKGNLDTCIAIRFCFKKNGKIFVRSGAGIVMDSVPEKEYEECINKARAVVSALTKADGGIH